MLDHTSKYVLSLIYDNSGIDHLDKLFCLLLFDSLVNHSHVRESAAAVDDEK